VLDWYKAQDIEHMRQDEQTRLAREYQAAEAEVQRALIAVSRSP
jgi:hypothetical protein